MAVKYIRDIIPTPLEITDKIPVSRAGGITATVITVGSIIDKAAENTTVQIEELDVDMGTLLPVTL